MVPTVLIPQLRVRLRCTHRGSATNMVPTVLIPQLRVRLRGTADAAATNMVPTVLIPQRGVRFRGTADAARSEEHTSELQSHSDLVCRLLLEKKNHLRSTG